MGEKHYCPFTHCTLYFKSPRRLRKHIKQHKKLGEKTLSIARIEVIE